MPLRAALFALTLVSAFRFCGDDEPVPVPEASAPTEPAAVAPTEPELPPIPPPVIETEGTMCERAYAGVLQKIENVRNHPAAAAMMPHLPEPPPRERFLEGCGLLPEEMQECLHPDYAGAHTAECQSRRDRVDVEVLRRAMAIVAP